MCLGNIRESISNQSNALQRIARTSSLDQVHNKEHNQEKFRLNSILLILLLTIHNNHI